MRLIAEGQTTELLSISAEQLFLSLPLRFGFPLSPRSDTEFFIFTLLIVCFWAKRLLLLLRVLIALIVCRTSASHDSRTVFSQIVKGLNFLRLPPQIANNRELCFPTGRWYAPFFSNTKGCLFVIKRPTETRSEREQSAYIKQSCFNATYQVRNIQYVCSLRKTVGHKMTLLSEIAQIASLHTHSDLTMHCNKLAWVEKNAD